MSCSWKRFMLPVNLNVPIERAQLVGLGRREAGRDDRDLHRLLLEQRHPERLSGRARARASGSRRGRGLRAGAGRDAPCRPGSGRAGRSRPRSRGRRTSAASSGAAWPSAPGSRSGRRRPCRPRGSWRRSPRPPAGWWRGRARCPCARARRSKQRRMQPSMPRPSTSTFMNLRASMSSLSHSITCRSCHGGGLDRHELVEPVLRQHEPARVLREVARNADERAGELQREPRGGGRPDRG